MRKIKIKDFEKALDLFLRLKLNTDWNWDSSIDGMGLFINIKVGPENFSDFLDENEDVC